MTPCAGRPIVLAGCQLALLIFGGILVALSTLSGVFDGIRDGGHLVFLALLAITLPGSFAIALSWRHIRAS